MSTTAADLTTHELPVGTWELDTAHTSVDFVARHMMVTKVRGHFGDFDGRIHIGESLDDGYAEASFKTSSIYTNQVQRDEHLRSGDFLEIERYPEMTFRTTKVEPAGKGKFTVAGDLTIKDVTRPIELEARFHGTTKGMKGDVLFFEAEGEFDREDFGLTWNMALEGGGWLVSKKIRLEIEGQAVRQEA
ncbi:MAG: YceI family protein [Actinomycetota bacterium]